MPFRDIYQNVTYLKKEIQWDSWKEKKNETKEKEKKSNAESLQYFLPMTRIPHYSVRLYFVGDLKAYNVH